ncbi:Transcription factor iws1 [Modicella reniformis]|uniref:Transcription factor iws1 n=1 Tax=Modicella reniformis TaxID=1440133 RepID=A0A9P6SUZ8_9FUNG|nr:Transcription factor iws1 [Modicella reniformis]
MSSDKKRIEHDIFGDDDDEDEDVTYSDDQRSKSKNDGTNNNQDDQEYTGDDDTKETEGGDGEEGEEIEEGVPLPSFKKRNADGQISSSDPKKKKITKKPKSTLGGVLNSEGGGDDLPLDPQQQALLKLEKVFELALKSGKSTTRRRRKDEEDIDSELDDSAARFVGKMREAAFADIDAKLKHQSALSKVRMLESVKKQLNKSHVHSTFLENGLLEAMKLWLEPLQDASLPSLDIIQDFLDILDILPIQTLHLVNSGVGRVVYFYTKVDESRVTPAIKRKAHALVDKWSRPIVKLSQDFRDKRINYADDNLATSQRRRFEAPTASNPLEIPTTRTLSVRVPQLDRNSYALMPESSITYDKSRSGKSDRYKKLKSHMAKIKQIKRS